MAGKKNNISQQKISYAIKALENELGVKIFDRDAKGVKITSIGSEVLSFAEEFIAEITELKNKYGHEENQTKLELTMHMSEWMPYFFVTKFMLAIFKEYSFPIENILKKHNEELMAEIVEDKIDIAFIATQKFGKNDALNIPQEVFYHKIAQFVPCFLVNQNRSLAKQKYLKWAEIIAEAIVCEKNMEQFLQAEEFIKKNGKLSNLYFTENISIIKKMLENDLAIGFDLKILNQKSELEEIFGENNLKIINLFPANRFYVEVGYICKKETLKKREVKKILEILQKNY